MKNELLATPLATIKQGDPVEENKTTEQEAMLTAMEARILGALMEKQLTTPDAYPLTLNSLILACNQKTSREPVTNYEQGEVQRCASEMQEKKWIELDYGARAARYDQRLTRVLGLDKGAQALLNVMLLRGPQTLAELLTRTQRMFEFESVEAIEEKLQHLCAKTTPHFVKVPRGPGQREDRYMHLLCGEPDLAAIASMTSTAKTSQSGNDEQVAQLTKKVELLESAMEKMEKKLALLMELNGVSEGDLEG